MAKRGATALSSHVHTAPRRATSLAIAARLWLVGPMATLHPAPRRNPIEAVLERGLFLSRWLMAPFYIGLALTLGLLAYAFGREFVHSLPTLVAAARPEDVILVVLSLVDMSLAGNLLLIVIFSGYESFVSKIETSPDDRPDWMGKVDFSGMKMKLIASIVAISAITLLKSFMVLGQAPLDERRLYWQVVIHLTFVASGVLLALMDWLASLGEKHGARHSRE
jgi:uncharacterized protein (TIGR00645 family)